MLTIWYYDTSTFLVFQPCWYIQYWFYSIILNHYLTEQKHSAYKQVYFKYVSAVCCGTTSIVALVCGPKSMPRRVDTELEVWGLIQAAPRIYPLHGMTRSDRAAPAVSSVSNAEFNVLLGYRTFPKSWTEDSCTLVEAFMGALLKLVPLHWDPIVTQQLSNAMILSCDALEAKLATMTTPWLHPGDHSIANLCQSLSRAVHPFPVHKCHV